MKTFIPIKKKLFPKIIAALLIASSCTSSQQASYYEDGIYASDDANYRKAKKRAVIKKSAERNSVVNAGGQNYSEYFGYKSNIYNSVLGNENEEEPRPENDILTDINSYSSVTSNSTVVNADNVHHYNNNNHSGWGNSISGTPVNIYASTHFYNGLGWNSGYLNSGYWGNYYPMRNYPMGGMPIGGWYDPFWGPTWWGTGMNSFYYGSLWSNYGYYCPPVYAYGGGNPNTVGHSVNNMTRRGFYNTIPKKPGVYYQSNNYKSRRTINTSSTPYLQKKNTSRLRGRTHNNYQNYNRRGNHYNTTNSNTARSDYPRTNRSVSPYINSSRKEQTNTYRIPSSSSRSSSNSGRRSSSSGSRRDGRK